MRGSWCDQCKRPIEGKPLRIAVYRGNAMRTEHRFEVCSYLCAAAELAKNEPPNGTLGNRP